MTSACQPVAGDFVEALTDQGGPHVGFPYVAPGDLNRVASVAPQHEFRPCESCGPNSGRPLRLTIDTPVGAGVDMWRCGCELRFVYRPDPRLIARLLADSGCAPYNPLDHGKRA